MNWDEKAADAAIEYAKPTMRPVQTLSDHLADAFHAGARWQRQALLDGATVTEVARNRDVIALAEDSGADPAWVVRTVIEAAIGGE